MYYLYAVFNFPEINVSCLLLIDSMKQSVKTAWISIICLIFGIGLPIGIWCLFILRNDWNKIYIIKRRRTFVITLLVCLCLLAYGYPTVAFIAEYFPNQSTSIAYWVTYEIIFLPATVVVSWMIICRFWIFYYDSKLIEFETNKKWRMAIDPIKESDNWFVQNVKKYGNTKYLLKGAFIATIVESLVYIILLHVVDAEFSPNRLIFSNLWFFLLFAFPALPIIWLFYKITSEISKDNLGILKEIIGECVYYISAGVLGIVGSIVVPVDYFRLMFVPISTFLLFIMMFLAFPYPQRLFNKYKRSPVNLTLRKLDKAIHEFERNKENDEHDKTNDMPELNIDDGSKSNSGIKKIKLKSDSPRASRMINSSWTSIISSYDGYVAFMNHLGQELSTENLLFVQEVE